MENSIQLNLARKWRSKNFDQIVGQDLAVRILKNSLFLNQFFPVYLFSGQRGCGKTSMARIFTAALNCDNLTDFQSNPKGFSVPCLSCVSCDSIAKGRHPDFIEIDAASYTGVDNVRQIIDNSTLLPVMGRKKVFLIDEAHMLSKAAFNAFLKILEEPPPSVIFILATTDVEKIIDTIRSRSFQLFFNSIDEKKLFDHLKSVCENEKIKFEESGLQLIIRESEGSARDALNLLEQVRFSVKAVDKESVAAVLGYTSDENILKLWELVVVKKSTKELLEFLDLINFSKVSPSYVWNRLLDLFRVAIRLKNGIDTNFEGKEILASSSYVDLLRSMELFCENEVLFNRAGNKHLFLEMLFLRTVSSSSLQVSTQEKKSPKQKSATQQNWARFIEEIKLDPLVSSVFVQAKLEESEGSKISISFDAKYVFFKDLIEDTKKTWEKALLKSFGADATLDFQFKKEAEPTTKDENTKSDSDASGEKVAQEVRPVRRSSSVRDQEFDVSDKDKWIIANNLLKQFGGTIHEVKEER